MSIYFRYEIGKNDVFRTAFEMIFDFPSIGKLMVDGLLHSQLVEVGIKKRVDVISVRLSMLGKLIHFLISVCHDGMISHLVANFNYLLHEVLNKSIVVITMETKMKIGIFGITANPPHRGHAEAIRKAAVEVDEIWITPVFVHPFGKKTEEYGHRLEMLRLMAKEFSLERAYVKELDRQLAEKTGTEKIYSYDLLVELKKSNPLDDFKLVIGADNATHEIWSKFKNRDKIEDEFGLIVSEDVGKHSSDIRGIISSGGDPSELVGTAVAEYIEKNALYR